MTLLHVALKSGQHADLGQQIGRCIHQAIEHALGASSEHRLQIVTEQAVDLVDRSRHGDKTKRHCTAVVMIYLTLPHSRRETRALFGRITESLNKELQIGPEEIVIGLVQSTKEDWWLGYRQAVKDLPYQLP